jgi:hypothetical protein
MENAESAKKITDGDYSLLYPELAKTLAVHWHGYKYITNDHTDGGALKHHFDYLKAVKMLAPNKKWHRGLDWCAGDGGLGMMFLGETLVEHITFMDYYDPAIKGCEFNIKYNNIQDKTKVIKENKIANLNCGKFDFVIGNAPSQRVCSLTRMYELGWLSRKETPMSFNEALKDKEEKNPHRAIDWDWETHKEFIANITKHLVDDADIFLFENPKDFNPLFWEWGDLPKGLKLVQWVDHNQIPELNRHPQVILHFKYHG